MSRKIAAQWEIFRNQSAGNEALASIDALAEMPPTH
jgi:hypothetical protein